MQSGSKKNEPLVPENTQIEWGQPRGTQVVIEVEGRYQKGRASVDEYLEQTSIGNPHVRLIYRAPEGETKEYPHVNYELPSSSREIKPHPTASSSGCSSRCIRRPEPDPFEFSPERFLSGDACVRR